MKILSKSIVFLIAFFSMSITFGQDTYLDNFNNESYSNNNGTKFFSTDWVETNEKTNPNSGSIRINGDKLIFDELEGESIRRNLNLAGASNVTLTIDYAGPQKGGAILWVELWDGSSWQKVLTLDKKGSGLVSYSLKANQISSSSGIRFISGSGEWNDDRAFYVYSVLFTVESPSVSNEPPTIIATGNQSYCPGTAISILESVSITDPDDTTIDKVFVQISSNYDNGKDELKLMGDHSPISGTWNALEGKLTLTGPATFAAFEAALKAVVFNTTATLTSGNTRNFSIVLSEANYLISTEHYYEYVPALGITWTAARDAAAARKFYGLQGYLATLTIADEAALLGKQSKGAGWIGASDKDEEGEWRWVTGPETGTQFWQGVANGSTTPPYNYANWNNGEPNQSGDEDYAHINAPGTGFDGSWNDLPLAGGNDNYQPKGYLVEYGGMLGDPPYPKISAVTSITVNSVSIIAQPVDQITIAGATASFLVSANNADTYQWQVSTNGGTSFVNIADGTDYSGTQTNKLSIPNSNMAKNGHRYRVIVSNSSSDCSAITSDPAVLIVQVGTVITNKRITYRVKGN